MFLSSKEGKEKSTQSFMERYGVTSSLQIPSAMKKFKQTLMAKYGVPSLAYLSRPASKESQKLFWEIHNSLSKEIQEKSHFAELNREFILSYDKKHFKYDFVNSILLKAIEYNGYSFHPKPEQLDEEIGWCAFHPNKTVKEAKEYENIKYKALETRGFKILTIWDYEYHKDYNKLVKKCIDFLTQKTL